MAGGCGGCGVAVVRRGRGSWRSNGRAGGLRRHADNGVGVYEAVGHVVERNDAPAVFGNEGLGFCHVGKGDGILRAHATDVAAFNHIMGGAGVYPFGVGGERFFPVGIGGVAHVGYIDGGDVFGFARVAHEVENLGYGGEPQRFIRLAFQEDLRFGPVVLGQVHGAVVALGGIADDLRLGFVGGGVAVFAAARGKGGGQQKGGDEFFHGGFLVCEWSFQAALGGLFEVFPIFGAVWGGIADDADVAVAQQDDEAADAENPAVQKV